MYTPPGGKCVPDISACGDGTELKYGECVPDYALLVAECVTDDRVFVC